MSPGRPLLLLKPHQAPAAVTAHFCFRDPETLAESAQVTSTGWCFGGMAAVGPESQYNCHPPSSLPKRTAPKPGPPLCPREASGGTAMQGDRCNLGARARRGASPPPRSHLIHPPHFSPHMGAWQGLPARRGPTTLHFLWCSISGGFRHPHPTCAPGAMGKALPLGTLVLRQPLAHVPAAPGPPHGSSPHTCPWRAMGDMCKHSCPEARQQAYPSRITRPPSGHATSHVA